MRIHCLQHVPYEGPALIRSWAADHGHEIRTTYLYDGADFPDPKAIDSLIVVGGPMGAYDDKEYPWMPREKTFIEGCIGAGRPVMGICLGAQLIADVLGARVYPGPRKEIGWFPIHLTSSGRRTELLEDFPDHPTVFHWHGDTFNLPQNTVHLARSEAYVNQAFLYDDRVLGVQFHLEFSRDIVEQIIAHSSDHEEGGRYVQSPAEMLAPDHHFKASRQMLYQLLNRWTAIAE